VIIPADASDRALRAVRPRTAWNESRAHADALRE